MVNGRTNPEIYSIAIQCFLNTLYIIQTFEQVENTRCGRVFFTPVELITIHTSHNDMQRTNKGNVKVVPKDVNETEIDRIISKSIYRV